MGLEDLMDREIRKALEIDPTSEWVKLQIYIYYQVLNRYDDYLRVRNDFFPEDPISPGYYLVKNDLAKAREYVEDADKKDPQGADPVIKAMLYSMKGKVRESEALLPIIIKFANTQKMKPSYHHNTYDIACIYAANGNATEAVKWLRETATKGNPSYTLFTRDIFLDKIRRSPEFIQFMEEMKPIYERRRAEFK